MMARRAAPPPIALALAALIPLAACGRDTRDASSPAPRLVIFAAASLAGAFEELAAEFRRRHRGADVRLSFAGSHQIALQIRQGARADLFATADPGWLEDLERRGLLAGPPVEFAANRLAVLVPASNPARIATLSDLSRPKTRLVLGVADSPIGRYARELLRNVARSPGVPPDFLERALANLVSEEENVKAIAAKVALGEADVGVVYRSDITPGVADWVRSIEIPDSLNVTVRCAAARLQGARNPDPARAFLALLLSPDGQAALERHGLLPKAAGG